MKSEELARQFEEHRPYLRRLAYSTLGSLGDADDVVQEAWLRLQRTDADEIENLRAWLTTVTGRLSLDALGSARARREQYVGTWLPEPQVAQWTDPADRVSQDERVTMALLVVLESLSPAERTAFVLQEVFGLSSREVGEVVGRTPAAVRQLVTRARKHVEDGSPRFPATSREQTKIVHAFALAWRANDFDALLSMLDSDVTLSSDGGGKVVAVRHPVHGSQKVAELLSRFARATGGAHAAPVWVNGFPGLFITHKKGNSLFSFTVDGGRITELNIMRNPDKLHGLQIPEDAENWIDRDK